MTKKIAVTARTKTAERYHHGDLKAALVSAARELVRSSGTDQVTLRRVASMAGVSQMAPYHHFRDKSALLGAVAAEGFRQFARVVRAAGEGEREPVARLRKLAVGYVEFAVREPRLFRLMYGPGLDHKSDPELAEAGAEAVGLLSSAVRDCLPGAGPDAVRNSAAAAWSLVHGLAVLCNDGRISVTGRKSIQARVMAVTAHFDVSGRSGA